MDITIIGSFRKYYEEICEIIDTFEKNSIRVLSPKRSYVTEDINGFVLLASDEQNQKPFIIQEHVFENIRKSELVYVWNPDGYLGNSTCYEIGKVMEMGVPIAFKEFPKDLPVRVEETMIKSIQEIIDLSHRRIGGRQI